MLRRGSIVLRTVQEADLTALHALEQEVSERGPFYPIDLKSYRTFRKQFDEDGFWGTSMGMMVIEAEPERRLVGSIAWFKSNSYIDGLELGFRIYRQQDRGKGYMTTALPLMVSYLFEWRRISRIQAAVAPDNEASRKVVERCGFTLEGVLRQAIYMRGKVWDLELYSILRDESPTLAALMDSPEC